MAGELKHASVGTELDQTEWESPNTHILDGAAQGDIIYHNGTNLVRLPAGTTGYFLRTGGVSANPSWAQVSGAGLADGACTGSKLGSDVVTLTGTQTLTNKTLSSPKLTTPSINDTSADHQYIIQPSELTANRNITLPLLTADDTFVFQSFAQTLSNKTLSSPTLSGTMSGTGVLSLTSASNHSLRGLYIGTSPADPGANVLRVQSNIEAGGARPSGEWKYTARFDGFSAYGIHVQDAAVASKLWDIGAYPVGGAGTESRMIFGAVSGTGGNTDGYAVRSIFWEINRSGGTVTDMTFRTGLGAGVDRIKISDSTGQIDLLPNADKLNIGYATKALGGGATATLGTIGGSGPATATQNSWLKILINGAAYFIPVWQ